jgi:uncharacterized protein (DUF2062 family)
LVPFRFLYQSFILGLRNFAESADKITVMNSKLIKSVRQMVSNGLRQGVSPRRLALTLALGIAIGCLPVVGIPTLICAGLAVALRLNQPAIQAANYAVMPLQLLLIVPFIRMGGRIFGVGHVAALASLLHSPSLAFLAQAGGLAGQALLAWLLIAVPAVCLLTAMLTALLRRVPGVTAAEN